MKILNPPPEWEMINPTENNQYSLFNIEFEENELILFHTTPFRNLKSILTEGFKSEYQLSGGGLRSVSYAKRSSLCLYHFSLQSKKEDYVVFAVRFESISKIGIRNNNADIHVDYIDIQPEILGYCRIDKSFSYN